MKLGKLLGAGKSFFGWQGAVAYRANKRVYLPKFNPGPNPFATPIAKPQPAVAAPAIVLSVTIPPALEAEVAPEMAKPSPFSAPSPVRTPTWAEKLIPFRGAKPARLAPPPAMPNVQPEFSLHAVKVVHNDLSDAEVEVVPMKSRPATPAPPVPTAGGSMDFLGEPVFKTI
jgi:hypothetical protein